MMRFMQTASVLVLLVFLAEPSRAGEDDKATQRDLLALTKSANLIAATVTANDFKSFARDYLVREKGYRHYYKKHHKLDITARGWREFSDGVRKNFEDKHKLLAAGELKVTRSSCGKDGKFRKCELWVTGKGKNPEEPVELILEFIKIWGTWRLTSLE